MRIVAARENFVITVAHRPALAQASTQLLWQAAGAQIGGKHIVWRVYATADAHLGPVSGAHAHPCARRGPRIAHQGALHSGVKRASKGHRGSTSHAVLQALCIVPTHQRHGHRSADGGKCRMRVHVKTGEGVGQGKSGGHLIGHGHRPEHLFDTGIASLGFGQQSRQGVGPTVTGRIAKTFVEFAPGDGHAIGAGSGIAVHDCRTRGQHSGLVCG